MELNEVFLEELLNLLLTFKKFRINKELENEIIEKYGVLNNTNNQVAWLEFIIKNHT